MSSAVSSKTSMPMHTEAGMMRYSYCLALQEKNHGIRLSTTSAYH